VVSSMKKKDLVVLSCTIIISVIISIGLITNYYNKKLDEFDRENDRMWEYSAHARANFSTHLLEVEASLDDLSLSLGNEYHKMAYELESLRENTSSNFSFLDIKYGQLLDELFIKTEELNITINNYNFSLQSEISLLQSNVTSLITEINELKERKFHLIYECNGTEDKTSRLFTVKGDNIRLLIDAELSQTNGWIDIRFFYSNGTFFSRRTISGVYATISSDLVIVDPGTYFIVIETSHMQIYTVKIWDFY